MKKSKHISSWSSSGRAPEGVTTLLHFSRVWKRGSFRKSPFSRDSGEFRDSSDSRETPPCEKLRRIRPFCRDSREFIDFRESRDSSSEKTPFVMTPLKKVFFCTGRGLLPK